MATVVGKMRDTDSMGRTTGEAMWIQYSLTDNNMTDLAPPLTQFYRHQTAISIRTGPKARAAMRWSPASALQTTVCYSALERERERKRERESHRVEPRRASFTLSLSPLRHISALVSKSQNHWNSAVALDEEVRRDADPAFRSTLTLICVMLKIMTLARISPYQ